MSLLLPDVGLLFWMTVSFGIVFFILAKFGFPIITKAVEKRNAYIEDSLKAAQLAEKKLATLNEQADKILAAAQKERNVILNEAEEQKKQLIAEAKQNAETEARRIAVRAEEDLEHSKKKAIAEVKNQVAAISVKIAEKVIREKLADDDEQKKLINRLVDEGVNSMP